MVAATPPFSVRNSSALPLPILLSVPHAGRECPAEMAHLIRIPRHRLVSLEDRYADLLIDQAVEAGGSAIIAKTHRVWIDLNRAETDIDPDMVSGRIKLQSPVTTKARGGLGLVPRRTAQLGEIWRRKLHVSDIVGRIMHAHRPYHAAISESLDALARDFGSAILLDIHSMPPLSPVPGQSCPQIVIGDRFGRSAGAHYTTRIAEMFERAGLQVGINTPYPGNYLLEKHGGPQRGIHAIQIEVDRRLYLDEMLAEPGEGLGTIQSLIRDVTVALAEDLFAESGAIAAE